MLLYTAVLPIKEKLTKDDFIRLVLEWNRTSAYAVNRIPDIHWDGSRNVRFGSDRLWLQIEEYRNANTIAVRFEKKDDVGAVWDTEYVMNFTDRRMVIRLDRSYEENIVPEDVRFSTPHFISMLIEGGFVERDHGLHILREPHEITEENLSLLTDVINGEVPYHRPVVYISRTFDGRLPVDAARLAGLLKGVAHVLVQADASTTAAIREATDSNNPYNGAVGIYFPKNARKPWRGLCQAEQGTDERLQERVFRMVVQYGNTRQISPLYTWTGVTSAILRDRLASQSTERAQAEEGMRKALYELADLKAGLDEREESMRRKAQADARAEADKLLESFEEDYRDVQKRADDLAREVDRLQAENEGLHRKLAAGGQPVIFHGEQKDYYPGEIKDFVLAALIEACRSVEDQSRRRDVLQDIVQANGYEGLAAARAEELKRLLKGYRTMDAKTRSSLEAMGFTVEKDQNHWKVKYHGSDRYMAVLAATSSDVRSGKNDTANIIKRAF